jgi:hypothetical protein
MAKKEPATEMEKTTRDKRQKAPQAKAEPGLLERVALDPTGPWTEAEAREIGRMHEDGLLCCDERWDRPSPSGGYAPDFDGLRLSPSGKMSLMLQASASRAAAAETPPQKDRKRWVRMCGFIRSVAFWLGLTLGGGLVTAALIPPVLEWLRRFGWAW